jgi:hypothetical protein
LTAASATSTRGHPACRACHRSTCRVITLALLPRRIQRSHSAIGAGTRAIMSTVAMQRQSTEGAG